MRIAYVLHRQIVPEDGVVRKITTQVRHWRGTEAVRLFAMAPGLAGETPLGAEADVFLYRSLAGRLVAARHLAAAVTRWSPDLIYLRYSTPYPFLAALVRRFPTVIEINSKDEEEARSVSRARYVCNRVMRTGVLRPAAGFVCIAGEIAVSPGLRRFGKPALVLGNGIDVASVPAVPPNPDAPPRLLFLGVTDAPWHGVDKILEMARRLPDFHFDVVGLRRVDGVAGWPANVTAHGFLAAAAYEPLLRAAGVRTIVWSIQNATLDPALSRVGTRLVARASALLSGLTAALVSPSRVALQAHLAAGYRSAVVRMIPNGFDLDRFRPDPIARVAVRRELNLPPDTFLIGMMARFDPQKDHATFLRAAARLAGESRVRGVDPHFVLCGLDVDRANEILGRLVAEAGLEPAVHLLGLRRDMPRVTAALDIAALSSAGQEAFPLVAGEAMSCGVPCVVTDIGDASYLVGNTGLVVPARDPAAMAAAWAVLMAEGTDARQARGRAARERIARHFGLDAVARQYEDFYASLTSRSRSRARSNTTVASAE